MRIDIDAWEEILLTVTRNKTRSLLTAFGVFWGIFMLVVLLGGGNGLQDLMSSNFKGFAANSCFVWPQETGEAYKGFRKGRFWVMDLEDVKYIRKQVEGIEVVTPAISFWQRNFVHDDKKSIGILKGLYPDYERIEAQNIKYGRFINEVDIREARKVCVIGRRVYEQLFRKGENPCGKQIRVDGIYYQVIGMTDSESNIQINGRMAESVILPFTTMQQAYHLGNELHILCITAEPGIKITDLQAEVEKIVKERHYISPDDKEALMFLNAQAMFSMMDNLFKGIRILVWMVGLGTLLAGAIGVSNIMMVTVKERTVEIGIRRALGATPKDILQQILTESMVLTAVAGMTAISLGVLVLQVVEVGINSSGIQHAHFQVTFGMAVGTAALLLTLGSLAGLAPAYRAMAIKPIEAIRDE